MEVSKFQVRNLSPVYDTVYNIVLFTTRRVLC